MSKYGQLLESSCYYNPERRVIYARFVTRLRRLNQPPIAPVGLEASIQPNHNRLNGATNNLKVALEPGVEDAGPETD